MILLAWVLAPTSAYSENILDNMELKHGVAFFHDLKYPLGFTHFDYVNPDAPKGGKLVLATQLNFNTLAPQQEGAVQPPSEIGMIGDTLLVRAGDEVSAFYGRLADGIGITADQMAIMFRIHQDAMWNDGATNHLGGCGVHLYCAQRVDSGQFIL